jgi:hypothetical protein
LPVTSTSLSVMTGFVPNEFVATLRRAR